MLRAAMLLFLLAAILQAPASLRLVPAAAPYRQIERPTPPKPDYPPEWKAIVA